MTTAPTVEDELIGQIKVLSERVWEQHCREPDIRKWLANFTGIGHADPEEEKLHALHLLSHVSYFGLRELRVLLRSMYRDHFRYPLLQDARRLAGGSRDIRVVEAAYDSELRATRFLGMGNPAESGTHLLYYFRQENSLPKDLFVQEHALLSGPLTDSSTRVVPDGLKRIVFIDDLCGSGQQAIDYSASLLQDISVVAAREGRTIDFHYLVLFATETGLRRVKDETSFTRAGAVSRLDETYMTFGPESRVFRNPPLGISKTISEAIATAYGLRLWPDFPLGFGNRQLLLALHHNVPDNTLPIIWQDNVPGWHPAFPRFHKVG